MNYRLFVKFVDGHEEQFDVMTYSNGPGALLFDLPNGECWMWSWAGIVSVRAIEIDAAAPGADATV